MGSWGVGAVGVVRKSDIGFLEMSVMPIKYRSVGVSRKVGCTSGECMTENQAGELRSGNRNA